MEKKKPKQSDSIIVGAIVWSILFIGIGIFDMVTKKNGYWLAFLLGGLSLIFLIYLLMKTKNKIIFCYTD
jgi:inner membrane protein involved in colicin E2 resistance